MIPRPGNLVFIVVYLVNSAIVVKEDLTATNYNLDHHGVCSSLLFTVLFRGRSCQSLRLRPPPSQSLQIETTYKPSNPAVTAQKGDTIRVHYVGYASD